MIIVDNFLTKQELTDLKASIAVEVEKYNREFQECDFREEYDHFGTENSNLYYMKNEAREMLLRCLIDRGYFSETVLTEMNCTLRYHALTKPYYSTWHKDRMANWNSDEIDYIGVTLFLNDVWDYNDGGIYIYKEGDNDTLGHYVEPIGNRLILNEEDLYHAVTQINNSEAIRYSLQMFINKRYFLK